MADNNYEIISELNGHLLGFMNGVQSNNGNRASCFARSEPINHKFIFEPAFAYFPKPNFNNPPYTDPKSIVDALGSIGVENSLEYRAIIGMKNGITGDPKSPPFSIELLRRIKEGSLLIP